MFEKASRLKLRFETVRGCVGIEDLWDMPLINESGFCLDDVAKAVSRRLKEFQEESFVEKKTGGDDELELRLDIIKHIIAVKIADKEEAENAADRKLKKEKLMSVLQRKQDEELEGLSAEDIKKMIDDL